MMQRENIIRQIKTAEEKYKANDYKGNSRTPCVVEKYGDVPILLSAPHSVKQIRGGVVKAHEFYTGAIVECLAKEIGCSCITKQYLLENLHNDDPNTDAASCSYKTAVNQFMQEHNINLFIDIHGLSGKRDSIVDICIDGGKNVNTMHGVRQLQKMVNDKFGNDKASIDKYFKAFSENIMSKWVHTSFNISAIELEINGGYRWFEGETEKQSLELFYLLANWLKNIE